MNGEALFTQLVAIFHGSAMVALGKIKNPATDKIERNLDQAKQAIDMLEMLKEKTKGQLSQNEQRLLESSLTDLRLNYLDESQKGNISVA
jgi:F0F1-type ATP synthase membrane subunit b/b'